MKSWFNHPLLYVLILSQSLFSQINKEYTYSIEKEYDKQRQKYPQITIAIQKATPNIVEEQKDIVYQNINGRKLSLDSYIPKAQGKFPALILVHGGGWKSGDKSMMQSISRKIASYGYNCFAVEYRLSDEVRYPAAIDDILAAKKFITEKANLYKTDTTNIALLGCSSGGQIVSLIGTKFSNGIKLVINLDGILAFHHPESEEGYLASHWLGGNYEERPAIWEDASALTHVHKNMPPFLFINSQFNRFHAGRDEMTEKMKQFQIEAAVKTIKDSPHTFWLFHPWFDTTIGYIIPFLDRILKS